MVSNSNMLDSKLFQILEPLLQIETDNLNSATHFSLVSLWQIYKFHYLLKIMWLKPWENPYAWA